jgi:hypothetical protein
MTHLLSATTMKLLLLSSCIFILWMLPAGAPAAGGDEVPFEKHTIDLGPCETVTVADINRDHLLDIVSGDYWYEQSPQGGRNVPPAWTRHRFRDLGYSGGYFQDLSDLAIDVNGDGWLDIVSASYWDKPLSWWENPGKSGKPWAEHQITKASPVEFAFLVDLLNTGKADTLLPQFGDIRTPTTWYELDPKRGWIAHPVSPRSYGHGIGAGDVNGDGRTDIVTPHGWLEAPADPRMPNWEFHPEFALGDTGFIYTLDVNGDGLADLIASMGHDYGIFWMEQKRNEAGLRYWEKHWIEKAWSQAHALTLADVNGDGRLDIVSGKRLWAHETDPGANEPLGIYWYEQYRTGDRIQFRRHIIDYASRAGGGMQIPVVDLDGDGDLDILVAGKSGLFLFENLTR